MWEKTWRRERRKDEEKLKELMGLIFNLYCECDHTNWEEPLFENEELGGKIKNKLGDLEDLLWITLVDLEDSFGWDLKEVEMVFKSLKVVKKGEIRNA